MSNGQTYAVFVKDRLLVAGGAEAMLRQTKDYIDAQERLGGDPSVLIFEDETGRQVDFDFQGSPAEVIARVVPPTPRVGPGRPRLGVVAREISLLPRHWEWLEQQQNGASAALRRLVDEARKRDPDQQRARLAVESTYRVMTALCGDRPGYEEATRALYGGDGPRFFALIGDWPKDIADHLRRLAADAFLAAGADAPAAPAAT